jgi:hypothetical protein
LHGELPVEGIDIIARLISATRNKVRDAMITLVTGPWTSAGGSWWTAFKIAVFVSGHDLM